MRDLKFLGTYLPILILNFILGCGSSSLLVSGQITFDPKPASLEGATIFILLQKVVLGNPSTGSDIETIVEKTIVSPQSTPVDFELFGTIPDESATYSVLVIVDVNGSDRSTVQAGDYVSSTAPNVITNGNPSVVSIKVTRI